MMLSPFNLSSPYRRPSISRAIYSITAALMFFGISSNVFANESKIISALPEFQYAKDSALPFSIRAYVRENRMKPEVLSKFASDIQAAVEASSNEDALRLACSTLALVGSDEQIPFLAKQTEKPAVFAAAVTALQQMATPKAVEALSAFKGSTDDMVFICTALGRTRASGAEAFLAEQSKAESPLLRRAAFEALASIASPAAAKVFQSVTPSAEDGSAAAMITFFRNVAANDKTAAPNGILERVIADRALPSEIRIAAIRAAVTHKSPGWQKLLAALEAEPSSAAQAVMLENFGKLTPDIQARIIAGIQNPANAARSVRQLKLIGNAMPPTALLDLVIIKDQSLRIASIRSLAVTVDESTYQKILSDFLTTAPDSDKRPLLGDVLLAMPSKSNTWLLAALKNESDPVRQVALIEIIEKRNVNAAAELLVDLSSGDNVDVRKASAKAIATIGAPEQAGRIFELFLSADDPALQRDYGRALGISLTQSPDKASIIAQAKERYTTVEDARMRDTLLELLGRSGDPAALPLLFDEFQKSDKARKSIVLRAISNWPDVAPLDQLAVIAKEDPERASQVFALRAYLEILQRAAQIPAEVKLERLKEAQVLASRPEEHKMIISLLATVPLLEAQPAMATYAEDPAVAEEYKVGSRTLNALLVGVRLKPGEPEASEE